LVKETDFAPGFVAGCPDLPVDPVIEAYKKDVDPTLLRENLKLTPEQRLINLQNFLKVIGELRDAAKAIQVKRAAGRPKDFEALAELEALLEEKRKSDTN
jgi:hypothetical protein